MGIELLNAELRKLTDEFVEVQEKVKIAPLATGKSTQTISLAAVNSRVYHVKEIAISVGATGNEWGADGYCQVHRTDGTPDETPASDNQELVGEMYFNASSIILFDHDKFDSTALKLVIDHNAGVAKDVRINVRYFVKKTVT